MAGDDGIVLCVVGDDGEVNSLSVSRCRCGAAPSDFVDADGCVRLFCTRCGRSTGDPVPAADAVKVWNAREFM